MPDPETATDSLIRAMEHIDKYGIDKVLILYRGKDQNLGWMSNIEDAVERTGLASTFATLNSIGTFGGPEE